MLLYNIMYILWVFWQHLKNLLTLLFKLFKMFITPYYFRIIFTKWRNSPQIKLFLSYFYPNDQFLQYVNRCSIQELKWFYDQINVGKGWVKYLQLNRFVLQEFSELFIDFERNPLQIIFPKHLLNVSWVLFNEI